MVIEHMVKIEKPRRFDTRAFHALFQPRIESYTDVLTAKKLSIGYDRELSKVSFTLRRGERLAVIGENGIGKSTLLKTLTGLTGALGGSFSFGPNVEWGYFDQQAALSVQSDPALSLSGATARDGRRHTAICRHIQVSDGQLRTMGMSGH